MASALCYALMVLTGVLFLVLEPYNRNRNIRFHAFQSIYAWIAMIIVLVVVNVVLGIIGNIPFIGWLIVVVAWPLFGLACLGLWLFLMYKAYNGERFVLPVIGPLAEKRA